jgi:hypothetical protein
VISRVQIGVVCSLLFSFAVVVAAVWGVERSNPSGAGFVVVVSVLLITLVVGVPWAAHLVLIRASTKHRAFISSLALGSSDVLFASVWNPKIASQLRSAGFSVPVKLWHPLAPLGIVIVTQSQGVRLQRATAARITEIPWERIADVSYAESSIRGLVFPTVVISVLRTGGSVDLKFLASRADPAKARAAAQAMESQRRTFSGAGIAG